MLFRSKDSDLTKDMTPQQQAVVSDILSNTMAAGLTGGSPTAAINSVLFAAGSKALGDMVTTGFKSAVTSLSAAYDGITAAATPLQNNENQQKSIAESHDALVDKINGEVARADELLAARTTAVNAYNSAHTQATYEDRKSTRLNSSH